MERMNFLLSHSYFKISNKRQKTAHLYIPAAITLITWLASLFADVQMDSSVFVIMMWVALFILTTICMKINMMYFLWLVGGKMTLGSRISENNLLRLQKHSSISLDGQILTLHQLQLIYSGYGAMLYLLVGLLLTLIIFTRISCLLIPAVYLSVHLITVTAMNLRNMYFTLWKLSSD